MEGKLNLYTDSLRFVYLFIFFLFCFSFSWWLIVAVVVNAGRRGEGPPHRSCGNFIPFYEGFSAFSASRSE